MNPVLSFFRRRWYIVVLVLVLAGSIMFRLLTPPEVKKPASTWNDIIPGSTTIEEIRSKLGTEIASRQENGQLILEYKSSYPSFPNDVYTSGSVVNLVRQRIAPGDAAKYADLVRALGPTDFIVYTKEFEAVFPLQVHLDKGLAVGLGEDGSIMEIWYFTPTDRESFVTRFENYFSLQPQVKTGGEPQQVPPTENQ